MTSPTVIELMTTFYRASAPMEAPVRASDLIGRKPQRICATVPWHVVQRLELRASMEGRSLSGLVAYLLEVAG